jgi:hypothetical protein
MAKLESQTQIVVGRVAEPGDPARPWWWESTTTKGAEVTVAGYAATENDALLEATASTLDLQAAYAASREPAPAADREPRPSEVEIWAGTGNGSSASAHAGEARSNPLSCNGQWCPTRGN